MKYSDLQNDLGKEIIMKKSKLITIGIIVAVLVVGAIGVTYVYTNKTEQSQEKEQVSNNAVAAMVGDVTIYQRDVDNQMAYFESLLKAQFGDSYKENQAVKDMLKEKRVEYLNYLIEGELLTQKGIKENITVDDAKVEEKYAASKESYPSEEEFNKALETNNLTEEAYKERIKRGLIMQEYMAVLTKDVKVTEEAVKEYYDAHIADYTTGAGANMAHILVDSEEKAKEIKTKLANGSTFADLAKEYGTDSTKDNGGDLGFIAYDDSRLDKDFMAAAKLLKNDEISEPVKTQFGYHIIKVTGIQSEPKVKTLEEVKADIESTLKKAEENKILKAAVEEIKKEINVDILMKEETTDSEDTTTTDEKKDTTTEDKKDTTTEEDSNNASDKTDANTDTEKTE